MLKSIDNKCYKLVRETKTWFGAIDECSKRNSTVLTIEDQTEQGKIECSYFLNYFIYLQKCFLCWYFYDLKMSEYKLM